MRLLIINISNRCREQVQAAVSQITACTPEWKMIDATQLRIMPCKGCCRCMLVTPGECCIHDDGPELIKGVIWADNIVLIVDTMLNFVDHKGKNVMDRLFPLVSMIFQPRDGEVFHVSRYDTAPGIAILDTGGADRELMELWLMRVAKNVNFRPLGIASLENSAEVCKWML